MNEPFTLFQEFAREWGLALAILLALVIAEGWIIWVQMRREAVLRDRQVAQMEAMLRSQIQSETEAIAALRDATSLTREVRQLLAVERAIRSREASGAD